LALVAAIEAEFGRRIAVVWVFQAPTSAKLAVLMSETHIDHNWKHLVALNDGGYRSPLFCLNGLDGTADDFLNLARFLDRSLRVYGLRVGSHGNDEHFHKTFDTLMDSYAQEIRSVQPTGPYRICGFSFGGPSAFDVARRLEEAGEDVTLILLDAYPLSNWLVALTWFPRIVKMVQAHDVLQTAKRKLRNLFTYEVHRWLTGKDKDLRHALLRQAMKRKYTPFSGKVILFKSTEMDEGMDDRQSWRLQLDGYNGWMKHVKGRIDLIHVEAGHVGLMKEPAVKSVVSHLNEIL
jgi:thioesterase domain-containing protein